MGWIKWVGGGIAASLMAGAILFGVFVTGGGASAEDVPFEDELGLGLAGEEIAVMAIGGPQAEEWKALVAEKLGVTVEQLETAMQEAREELGLPEPGEGRPFLGGAIFGWHLHGAVDAAAELIGIDPADLIAGLREGKTLAQIGEENGVSRDELKAAIISAVTDKVNTAVENGRITQERANEIIAGLDERVEELLDKVHDGGPFGEFRETFRPDRGRNQ